MQHFICASLEIQDDVYRCYYDSMNIITRLVLKVSSWKNCPSTVIELCLKVYKHCWRVYYKLRTLLAQFSPVFRVRKCANTFRKVYTISFPFNAYFFVARKTKEMTKNTPVYAEDPMVSAYPHDYDNSTNYQSTTIAEATSSPSVSRSKGLTPSHSPSSFSQTSPSLNRPNGSYFSDEKTTSFINSSNSNPISYSNYNDVDEQEERAFEQVLKSEEERKSQSPVIDYGNSSNGFKIATGEKNFNSTMTKYKLPYSPKPMISHQTSTAAKAYDSGIPSSYGPPILDNDFEVPYLSIGSVLSPQRQGESSIRLTRPIISGHANGLSTSVTMNNDSSPNNSLKRRSTTAFDAKTGDGSSNKTVTTPLKITKTEYNATQFSAIKSLSQDHFKQDNTCNNNIPKHQYTNAIGRTLSETTNVHQSYISSSIYARPFRHYVAAHCAKRKQVSADDNISNCGEQIERTRSLPMNKVVDRYQHSPMNSAATVSFTASSKGPNDGFTLKNWHRLTEHYIQENRDYIEAGIKYYNELTTAKEKPKWSKDILIWRCQCLDTWSRVRGGYLPYLPSSEQLDNP
ncbi:hypothetical protein BDF20DRAFT_840532 [Mycotypha africana]|uniref:uncharacterized protein n=1 Tax=Mycotypha africana TaxID=64632 RepID=UPI002301867F|nr:uncharacterized protein BDF20DRAFT_840532 [Mycotypha africana]KAI8966996.1 hypothetical protein BDF20DRAFT_840532 [Mycotypha africana]